jgi:hypothetical protein
MKGGFLLPDLLVFPNVGGSDRADFFGDNEVFQGSDRERVRHNQYCCWFEPVAINGSIT